MSSRDGSAFVPSSVTVVPLTVTRLSSMRRSDARLEAMPACDKIFCKRSNVKDRDPADPSSVTTFESLFVLSWFRGCK